VLDGNQVLVRNLALLARDMNSVFVHYSSDYVFDGSKAEPWFEDDLPNPISRYGQSKLLGDYAAQSLDRHYLIRTSWVYGDGKNFIRTMYERASRGEPSAVVDDQFGRPTFARDIALFTKHLIECKAPFGTYNFSGAGDPVSWYEVAVLIYQHLGRDSALVSRSTSEDYLAKNPSSALRPKYSVLDVTKARETGFEVPDWNESLTKYLTLLDQSATP
jgi:dTDP-4-dehydrorhamnose 3,5-epimerase/reductase